MNYLLISVIAIIFFSMVTGYARGFIRFAVSLGATIATVALVVFAAPYVSNAIIKYTPIDDMIKDAIVKMIIPEGASIDIEGITGSLGGEELVSEGSLDALNEIMGTYELPLKDQIDVIGKANIPEFLKEGLLNNNNSEVYRMLGVENFVEYIAAYIVKLVVNIASFIITFILVSILFRAIIFSLDIITALPVLHGANRIAGAGLGIVSSIIIIWVIFLIITLLYNTEVGKQCFSYIERSQFLTFLYDNNLILNFLATIR